MGHPGQQHRRSRHCVVSDGLCVLLQKLASWCVAACAAGSSLLPPLLLPLLPLLLPPAAVVYSWRSWPLTAAEPDLLLLFVIPPCPGSLDFGQIVELLNSVYCLGQLLEFVAFIWLRIR